jgi:hypothetical protein
MDTSRKRVAVLASVGLLGNFENKRSLEEIIFDASKNVLDSLGLTIEDIDSLVLAGQDEIDGRVISIMPSTGPAGGVGKDTTLIASSSDHALIYGYLRLLAGQGKNVLVMGWAKPSESVDPDRAELMSCEPFLLRQIGMNNTIAAALQASKLVSQGLETSNSTGKLAWPLGDRDLPARGDSVYALVLAVEGSFTPGEEIAWIEDAGWTTMSYELGSRDVSDLSALKIAIDQISRRSPHATSKNWDAIEIAGDSEYVVRSVSREFQLKSGVEINKSGALADLPTSPFVSGLARMVMAIDRIKHLPKGGNMVAGIGFNGFAGQGAAVVVFNGSKGE